MNTAVMTYETWTRRTERPLLLVAFLFLVVLCVPVLVPDISSSGDRALRSLDYAIWVVFVIDYLVRLRLAADRRRFVRAHIPDLLVVLLPALRPLRLLRLLSIASMLARRGSQTVILDVTRFVAGTAALTAFLAAVAELDVERAVPGSNIRSFGDSLWWACTTITTVGYGDHYPVTVQGRLVAVALMVIGVALLGILTAGIAAWLVRQVSREPEIERAVTVEAAELIQVLERLTAIEQVLAAHRR